MFWRRIKLQAELKSRSGAWAPDFKQRLQSIFSQLRWLRHWFRPKPEPLTLLVMSQGHQEVEKIHLSAGFIRSLKIIALTSLLFVAISAVVVIQFIVTLPERGLMSRENVALRTELNRMQFQLESLETTLDRVERFDKRLRALTDVDKEFSKERGPLGQGGGLSDSDNELQDFSKFEVENSEFRISEESEQVLDRRQVFMIQRLFSRMGRISKDSELQSQSVEELFEVLKGRKLQLAATPSVMPLKGWVTSHFGYRVDPFTGLRAFHKGLDIVARRGAPIVASADGVVTFAGPNGSFGNCVKIFHGYGISTLYAHADELLVRLGQRVSRGDPIGTVGNSGRSTATHLHYEVEVHGVRVDPRKYILDRSL